MQHFPIFIDLRGKRVVVSGAGETAVAKLRLLLKAETTISVYGADPVSDIVRWADERKLTLTDRPIERGDPICARLLYAANDDPHEDARAAEIGTASGCLVNIVDNLHDSQFITPAIVDRDPVTVAIGTEGAAPVLARKIKAKNEEQLAPELGTLARIAKDFRPHVEALPMGRGRREFWTAYYESVGPQALADGGEDGVRDALEQLLVEALQPKPKTGQVALVGAGPGDPELLTLKARKGLHEADVVIYDRLVSQEILELARREATLIEVGKIPGGPSWSQDDINALLVEHAGNGAHVVRLKSGDATIFGRLDEEMDALDAAGIPFTIVPGITSASAAAATIKVSLTKRRRNSSFRFMTGQDVDGFAEHDWRSLAKPGAAAAVYMGVRAARFIQGRLMIHGADPATPVTAIENISRANQKIVTATVGDLAEGLKSGGIRGPAVLFVGLSPRDALDVLDTADAYELNSAERIESEHPPAAPIIAKTNMSELATG